MASGPARKYYLPTPDGAAALAEASRSWADLAATTRTVLARTDTPTTTEDHR